MGYVMIVTVGFIRWKQGIAINVSLASLKILLIFVSILTVNKLTMVDAYHALRGTIYLRALTCVCTNSLVVVS